MQSSVYYQFFDGGGEVDKPFKWSPLYEYPLRKDKFSKGIVDDMAKLLQGGYEESEVVLKYADGSAIRVSFSSINERVGGVL